MENDDDDVCVFCGSSDVAVTWQDGSGVCQECQDDCENEQWEAHLNGQ